MPRTVTSYTVTETAKLTTWPALLVELGFDPPLYLSTRGEITWNSILWADSDVQVDGPRLTGNGQQEGRLSFVYTDELYDLFFEGDQEEKTCKIYNLYGTDFATGDVLLVFEGVIDGREVTTSKIAIDYSSGDSGTSQSPRLFVGQVTRHIMAPGTKIVWDSEIIVVEGD